jgi:nucleotide-binding universal stress UspA family protein
MLHILFPVAFSPQCDRMASVVAAVARCFQSRVTLFHVLELSPLASDFAVMQEHFQTLSEELQGRLKAFHEEDFAGLEMDHVFKTGHAAHEIVSFAHAQKADLIMMPTHGFTKFRQLLLGSVTAAVLHDARCPVWTTAHAEEASVPAGLPASIVCAVDLSLSSSSVVEWAEYFAARFGAELRLVHAGKANGVPGVNRPVELIDPTHVGRSVSAAATKYGAGLVVIGRGRIHGVIRRLRSNAHDIIRMSPSPVLSV